MFEQMESGVDLSNNFSLEFHLRNFGFGSLYFYVQDEKIHCSNENMNKEKIKEILSLLVDQCILDDPKDK